MLIDQPLSACKDGTNVHRRPMGPTQHINEGRHQPIEKAKVALKSHFPWLEILVHTAPLTIIGALLWVHITKTFWSDFEVKKQRRRNMELKAFQFAAKIHELLMLSSLSFIVFYYMRKLLVGRTGIPFGLVSAPHLTNSPGMLLHKSFWVGWRHHIPFGGLIFLACILSFALGPSSAISMIPSLGWFEMKSAFPANSSTILYNATAAEIWPTNFTASMSLNATEITGCLINPFNPSNLDCPTAGFMDIYKWFASFTRTESRNDLLFTDLLSSVQRKVAVKTDSDSSGTSAYTTVITEQASRTLGSFYNFARRNNAGGVGDIAYPRLRITADTPLLQPVVVVKCSMSFWHGDSNRENISFPDISQAWRPVGLNYGTPGYVDASDVIFDGLPDEDSRFEWYKESGMNASTSLLALAIVPIVASNSSTDGYRSSAIVACSIDARWAASDAYYQPANSTTVSSNVSDTLSDTLSETDWQYGESLITRYALSDKPLDLQLDWAAFLNGNQTRRLTDNPSPNITGMAMFLNTAIDSRELDNGETTAFSAPNVTSKDAGGAIEEAIAMLLGVVLTDGIARSSSEVYSLLKKNTTTESDVVTVLENYLGPNSDVKWGPGRYVPDFYSVRIKLDSYGYGYGLWNTALWAAMAVLLLFALSVLVHVSVLSYAGITGRYYGGECWEDVAGLVALAMNTTPTTRLHGTSAGVECSETWRGVVKIREIGGEHLELCFVDQHHEDGQTVQIGKKYL